MSNKNFYLVEFIRKIFYAQAQNMFYFQRHSFRAYFTFWWFSTPAFRGITIQHLYMFMRISFCHFFFGQVFLIIALEQLVFILWQFAENLGLQPSEACHSHFIFLIVLGIYLSSYIKFFGLILFMEYNLLLTVSLSKVCIYIVRWCVSCFEQGYVNGSVIYSKMF